MFISVHGVFLVSLSMYLQYQKDEIKVVGGWAGGWDHWMGVGLGGCVLWVHIEKLYSP